jgi:Fe-S-cluster containining protein
VTANIRYDCARCPGYCCSYDHIEVSDYDISRLARHFEVSDSAARSRFFKTVKSEGKDITVLRHRKDTVYKSICAFFDQKERRCTVYEARPRVCRSYPNGNTCGYYGFIKFERDHQDDAEFIPDA